MRSLYGADEVDEAADGVVVDGVERGEGGGGGEHFEGNDAVVGGVALGKVAAPLRM
jgi:hypothetical protein